MLYSPVIAIDYIQSTFEKLILLYFINVFLFLKLYVVYYVNLNIGHSIAFLMVFLLLLS